MALPLLSAAIAPLLFTADCKRRAEPGGSTLGECWRVQYIQYQDAENLAQQANQPGEALALFYARLIEKRATFPAVAHDPSQYAMLRAEIEAITHLLSLIEALDDAPGNVTYLPIPRHAALAERRENML